MKDIWSCWKYQVCTLEKEPHQSSKKMLDDSFPIQIESWWNAKVQGQCLVALSLSLSSLLSFYPVPGVRWNKSHKLVCRKIQFWKWRMVLRRKWWLCFHFHHLTPLQTWWDNKKKLSGGMALQGNSWSCSCENVWLGRWLRRWMREVEQY